MTSCARVASKKLRIKYWREDFYLQCVISTREYCRPLTILSPCILQPPAPYYTLYPRAQPAPTQQQQPATGNNAASSSKPNANLITKYDLQGRVAHVQDAPSTVETSEVEHKWEDSAEKRESNLRERKARMVLAARECVIFIVIAHTTLLA